MGIPFVTSVPIRRNGATAMVPEPNFPAQPDEFVGRDTQIEAFRQVLAQGRSEERRVGKGVLPCVDLGGRRSIKKKKRTSDGDETGTHRADGTAARGLQR